MRPAFSLHHRDLDPRAKLAFLVVVVVLTVAVPDLALFAALGALLLGLVAVGRGLGVREWLGFLAPFKLLIPAIFVLNSFFYGSGAVLWAVPLVPLSLTTGGIHASAVIATRLVVLAGAATWFAVTTEPEAFEEALVRLGIPWSFAFVLSLTIRLVPEIRDRFRTIDEAQRSRGLTLEGGPIERVRSRIPLLVPLLVSVIRYGYELGEALVVRDFGAVRGRDRTSLVSLEHGRADYLFYLFSIGVLVSFLAAFAR